MRRCATAGREARLLFLLAAVAALVSAQARHEGSSHDDRSCGPNSIPYKIVVDRHGRPELACETPACFLHPGDPSEYRKKRVAGYGKAVCSRRYLETVCSGENEWTAGLSETNNGTHRILRTECCSYHGLVAAFELKTVVLEAGDSYEGGRVPSRPAFDLVKEVRKTVTPENHVQYVVTIYRMVCESEGEFFADDRHAPYRPYRGHRGGYPSVFGRGGYHESPRRPPPRAYYGRQRPVFIDDYYDDYDYVYVRRPFGGRGRGGGGVEGGRPLRGRTITQDDRLWPVFGPQPKRARVLQANGVAPNTPLTIETEDGRLIEVVDEEGDLPAGTQHLAKQVEPAETETVEQTRGEKGSSSVASGAASAGVYEEVVPVATPYPPAPVATPPPVYQPQPAVGGSYGQEQVQVAPAPAPVETGSYSAGVQPVEPAQVVQPAAPVQTVDTSYAAQPYQPIGGSPYAAVDTSAAGSYAQAPASYQQPAASYNSYTYPQTQLTYDVSQSASACCTAQTQSCCYSSLMCFAGDMVVETPTGSKLMKDVEVGDLVLSIEDNLVNFSPVILHLHRVHDEEAVFIQLELEDGHKIKLTDLHLIYVTGCTQSEKLKTLHAKDVRVGQCLHIVDGKEAGSAIHPRNITRITRLAQNGYYSPLTQTGDIMVNGVVASCHSNLSVKALQHSFFQIYSTMRRRIMHFIASFGMGEGALPFGVEYLTTVMTVFLPVSY